MCRGAREVACSARAFLRRGLLLLAVSGLGACGGSGGGQAAPIAVLSAFPAELAPLLERAELEEEVQAGGREFLMGVLGGVRVVLGLTGIGLANASATARVLFEEFDVRGVVFSGVAGSIHRIGDVTVPDTWVLDDGSAYPVDARWLEVARVVAAEVSLPFARCTLLPGSPSEEVCLPHEPGIFVGGAGRSSDPFGGMPFPCSPGGGEVFGCELPGRGGSADGVSPDAPGGQRLPEALGGRASGTFVAEDMETAAVAAVASAHGVPFLAFRAVSDGAGDPLGLPGFPAQFFAYYRLAAHNAAVATVAFLERLGGSAGGTRSVASGGWGDAPRMNTDPTERVPPRNAATRRDALPRVRGLGGQSTRDVRIHRFRPKVDVSGIREPGRRDALRRVRGGRRRFRSAAAVCYLITVALRATRNCAEEARDGGNGTRARGKACPLGRED